MSKTVAVLQKLPTNDEIVTNVDWLCHICPAQCKFAYIKEFSSDKLEYYTGALEFNFHVFKDILLEDFRHIELFICAFRGILSHLMEKKIFLRVNDKDIITLILQEMVEDSLSSQTSVEKGHDSIQHRKKNENNKINRVFEAVCSQCQAKIRGSILPSEEKVLYERGTLTKVLFHSNDHALVVTLDKNLRVRRFYTYTAEFVSPQT